VVPLLHATIDTLVLTDTNAATIPPGELRTLNALQPGNRARPSAQPHGLMRLRSTVCLRPPNLRTCQPPLHVTALPIAEAPASPPYGLSERVRLSPRVLRANQALAVADLPSEYLAAESARPEWSAAFLADRSMSSWLSSTWMYSDYVTAPYLVGSPSRYAVASNP
jgi:hypothetical protein